MLTKPLELYELICRRLGLGGGSDDEFALRADPLALLQEHFLRPRRAGRKQTCVVALHCAAGSLLLTPCCGWPWQCAGGGRD